MHDDENLPPSEELPMEVPAPTPEDSSIENKEFLVSEAEHSVNVADLEGGEVPGGPVPDGEPSESLEALLAGEVLPEGAELPSVFPEPAPPLPEHPTFQMQLRSLTDEARTSLRKALDAAGVQIPEKAWTAAVPVLSQLTEYQAVLLLQAARALGLAAEAAVVMPDAVPSEDDVALGGLLSVPEASSVLTESAPSVTLPRGEKEVVLCTPDRLPGASVRETFGVVISHRSIARRLFREEDLRDKLQRELRAVPKSPGTVLPSSHLQLLLRELLADLRKNALAKGANTVLGVKIEAFPESNVADPQLEQLRLVAFGTAAVVEKS